MKALLICPSDRPDAAFFSRHMPLALAPLLGRRLLDRALTRLAHDGVTEVRVLAADRPTEIRAYLSGGSPWGLTTEVVPMPGELSPGEAARRYGWPEPDAFKVETLDTWPGDASSRLWDDPAAWLPTLMKHLPAAGQDSVGMREFSPGVWLGTKARVSSRARFIAPCWVGQNAWIGSDTVIGPCTVVEADACVDEGAEISHSHIGPATYVGSLTELRDSLAWGRGLLNWRTKSFTEITDALLLADLGQGFKQRAGSSLIGRIAALLMLVATSPVLLAAFLRASADGLPAFNTFRGVRSPVTGELSFAHMITWSELNGVNGLLRRWPQLWSIVRGDFAWVGNRPLTFAEAQDLVSDFEQLWLHVAPGLFSMADAEGCEDEPFGDVARAHAAFYTAHASTRLDLTILHKVLRRTAVGRFLLDPVPIPTLRHHSSSTLPTT